MKTYIAFLSLLVLILTVAAASGSGDSVIPYYEDGNSDGINDLFKDSNGDGWNDYNLEQRMQEFAFEDADSNGFNDLFTDCDGDGVNDIYYISGVYPVIDANGDGFNDITGYEYTKGDYGGFRFGFIIDECGRTIEEYVDSDNDFMDDNYRKMSRKQMHDKFVDEDSDGISDKRKYMYRKGKYRQKNEN